MKTSFSGPEAFLELCDAQKELDLRQLDVSTAFLIPKLPKEEQIFMRPPPDAIELLRELGIEIGEDDILQLEKCIYGLRQASKYWNNDLVRTMEGRLRLRKVREEPCLPDLS